MGFIKSQDDPAFVGWPEAAENGSLDKILAEKGSKKARASGNFLKGGQLSLVRCTFPPNHGALEYVFPFF